MSEKEKTDSELVKRIVISAFIATVGWRPTGVQTGQGKIFFVRFPTNCNLQSMGKIVLPCRKGVPYVTTEGRLPCPCLSTMNAIPTR